MLDAVLFDLYGTTVDIQLDEDSPVLWPRLAAALSQPGRPIEPSDLRRRFHTFLREQAERGREGFLMEPVFRRLLTSLEAGDDISRIGKLFRELSMKQMHLRSYVKPLFERLHRSGVKVGIVSNTEALLTRFELDTFPVLQTAEVIVLSSDVGIRKPHPRIFQLAVNRIGATSGSTVFIGNDWAADVLGARHVGIRVIYLNEEVTDGLQIRTNMEGVYEVAPTLEGISTALHVLGWHSENSLEQRSGNPVNHHGPILAVARHDQRFVSNRDGSNGADANFSAGRGDFHAHLVETKHIATATTKPEELVTATKRTLPRAAPTITDTAIARRAYDLYLARGREDGHDVEDWLQAERELNGSTVAV